jgi:ATP-dependent DNA helicase DinG
MVIPSPHVCGLPPKFEAWRPAQEEALRLLLSSKKRIRALAAPTGFGKTAVYVAFALLSQQPTCIVTDNRGLQDQLLGEFESIGLVDLRGRRNYLCPLRNDYTCEEGYAARCPHKGSVNCPSSAAEMRAATSMLVVTNYDKWTSSRKFGEGMGHFTQVIFDEGHKAPEALARAMQVTLHHHEVEEVLGVEFPLHSMAEEMVNWKPWASFARVEAENLYLSLRSQMEHQPTPAQVKQFNHVKNLMKRLATLAGATADNWVVDETKEGYQFDPIRPGRYAESTLLLRIPTILFISATLRPKSLYMLGIAKDHFEYKEFDSDFDPKRCPIYHVPTMRVDIRAGDLSPLWIRHDQIAAPRQDRKGITHTISYARRDEVVQRSRFAGVMLINERGEASTQTVGEFKLSPPGTILVSPSVGEGFDFPGRDCEWQFVCKIPFPDGRSKIVKARQEDDKEYGPFQAMNKLVQIFGRGMRSKEDRCENFIADDHVEWFIPKYAHLAPRWFKMFYRTVRVAPQPPPCL